VFLFQATIAIYPGLIVPTPLDFQIHTIVELTLHLTNSTPIVWLCRPKNVATSLDGCVNSDDA